MRRLLRSVVLILSVVIGSSALATPGYPEVAVVEDRDDVAGRLDLSRVSYVHRSGEVPVWIVETYQTWRAEQLWDSGFLWIDLDTRVGSPADFTVMIRSTGSRMRASLHRVDPALTKIADLEVRRPTERSISIRLPLWLVEFGPARTTFRWWATSSFVGDACPATCIDVAPDDPADAPAQDAPGGPAPA